MIVLFVCSLVITDKVLAIETSEVEDSPITNVKA